MGGYKEFIDNKISISMESGFDIDKEQLNNSLFEYQKDIVRWSLKKGRSAIFADCGLGKTLMQLEFAQQIINRVGGSVLILAPLAVTGQTKAEGQEFGYKVNICESQEDVIDGINITNYEKLDRFIGNRFIGIVLDESSILKSFTGKIRDSIINTFRSTPYKLACTATPSPNDIVLDPFGGIGSTNHVALDMGRRAMSIELKESYYNVMVENTNAIVEEKKKPKQLSMQMTIDDFLKS